MPPGAIYQINKLTTILIIDKSIPIQVLITL